MSTTEEDNRTSLPSLEQLRTEAAIKAAASNPYSGKTRRLLSLFGVIVLSSSLIIGFCVAIAKSHKGHRQSISQSRDSPSFNDNVVFDETTNEQEDPSVFEQREESRFDDVIDFLSQTVTDSFDDENSPQYKAAFWIADQDYMNLDLPEAIDYDDTFYFTQRYILAVFYYALDGPNWRYKSKFLSEFDVCDWNFGLEIEQALEGSDEVEWTYGIQCNDDGEVSDIFMTNNNMFGALPEEMGDLIDLEHLALFKNNIYGGFPDRMRDLERLYFLSMESNDMEYLPDWISEWTSLQYLALGDNSLVGELPDLSGLENLVEAALDYNELSGSIDAFDDCPSLISLFLNNNKFDGVINDDTLWDLDNLEVLDLGENQLTGYIPSDFYDLLELDVHDNFLSEAPLSAVDREDSPMVFFSAYGNGISGPIPEDISSLGDLVHLDLSDNALTGDVPVDINSLTDLESLYLSLNDFTPGPMPYFGDLENLEEFSMASADLNGPIPDWIGDLGELVLLDLRDNDLTGAIPDSIGNLEWLTILMLNRNLLSGDVPESLADLEEIVTLHLDNNNMTGSLDVVCEAAPSKLAFFIADCGDEGTIDCECCSTCCDTGDETCNDWEDGEMDRLSDKTIRDQYLFSEDIIFRNAAQVAP